MATYKVLREMSYEPPAFKEAAVVFEVDTTFEYPSATFPTELDIVELIASEILEEV